MYSQRKVKGSIFPAYKQHPRKKGGKIWHFGARPRRRMTGFASVRRRIQKLSPYLSMVLLLIPVALVEPLKLIALFVAGKGHWLAGTGMIIGAYAFSLLVVERLFRVVKPKLMTLSWFAKLWARVVSLRNRVIPSASDRTSAAKQPV
jgi:hypothetical protein